MASLRETKDRIASVKSTLKTTSAMKLVASSKLKKSQKAIEALRPYENALNEILSSLGRKSSFRSEAPMPDAKVAVVAVSSNSALCGGFNSAVIKKALSVTGGEGGSCVVYSVGRKMADAMKKSGYPSPGDFNELVHRASYELSSALAETLTRQFAEGKLLKVLLVYSHFVSTGRQVPVVETLLPFSVGEELESESEEYIVEPSAQAIVDKLLPQLLMMRFHAAILDSVASEHAARTIAMQTATDNAQDLLAELTLEYNKGRQQKITSEILDLVGGSQQ